MRSCSFGSKTMASSPDPMVLMKGTRQRGCRKKNCIDSCGFCSFCGKIVVDTVEVTPLVDSSGTVFSKLKEKLLFGKNSRRHCHEQPLEEPMALCAKTFCGQLEGHRFLKDHVGVETEQYFYVNFLKIHLRRVLCL